MGTALLLSVYLRAFDFASAVLTKVGVTGSAAFGSIAIAAAGIVGAFAAVSAVSIKMATDFDQNMHKVYALTNTNAQMMAWYKQQILALSPAIDVSAADLANGLYFVVSAGFKGQAAMDVLKYSAMAAAAGMTDMKGVADAVTSVMNAYRSSALSAGTATDVLERLVANGKVEFSQIASSIGFTATTAAAAGVKVQEMAAAVSSLTQVAGAHGARRVQMEFDNLVRHIGIDQESVAKTAAKLGLSFDKNKFALMSFIDKLKYLATISGGVGYLDKTQAAAYMASGNLTNLAAATAQANSNFKALVGQAAAFIPGYILLNDKGKMYNSILAQMNGTGNYTVRAFDRMRESTGQLARMFGLSIQAILITFGEQLLPMVNGLLTAMIQLGRGIGTWLNTADHIKTFKVALVSTLVLATATLIGFGIALGAFVSPIFIIIGAFAAFIAAGVALGAIVQNIVSRLGGWNAVMARLHPILLKVQEALQAAGHEIQQAFTRPEVQQALHQLMDAFVQLKPLLVVIGFMLIGGIVLGFHLLVAALDGLAGALPGIMNFFRGLVMIFGGLGRLIVDLFTNWNDIPAALGQILSGLVTMVWGGLQGIVGLLGGFFGHFLAIFGPGWGDIGHAAGEALGHLGETIGGFFSGIGTRIHVGLLVAHAVFTAFVVGIQAKAREGFNTLLSIVTAPFRAIGHLFEWLYNHNYYIQALVNTVKARLVALQMEINARIMQIRALLPRLWGQIQRDAQIAWIMVQHVIVQPIEDAVHSVYQKFLWARAAVLGVWTMLKGDAKKGGQDFLTSILTTLGNLKAWAKQHIIDPITKPITDMIAQARSWGQNLIQMFVNGIKDNAGKIADAAKKTLGNVSAFLGFHSPAPKVPESAHWGANLIKMFALSMSSQTGVAASAAQSVMNQVAAALGGSATGSAAGSTIGAGSSGAGFLGLGTVVHNHWAGAFPNATSREEIAAGIAQAERQSYRKARRVGANQGVRAGTLGGVH